MKLNIGAGKDIRIGWENTDKENDWFTMEHKEESIDAILLNHVVMYMRPEELDPLLAKYNKWLKVGGTLHIETQNIEKVSDVETLYGVGDNAGHRWGWTPRTLMELMIRNGFACTSMAGILHGKPERDFLICGRKI